MFSVKKQCVLTENTIAHWSVRVSRLGELLWFAFQIECSTKHIHAGLELWAAPRFVFNASTSHSALATINATGKIKTAFCKFPPNESASRPTISGDHMSPNRWIVKMETAMALARRFTGAVSKMSVLTGPVGRNRKNIAAARKAMDQNVETARNAPNASGTAISTESPSVHA